MLSNQEDFRFGYHFPQECRARCKLRLPFGGAEDLGVDLGLEGLLRHIHRIQDLCEIDAADDDDVDITAFMFSRASDGSVDEGDRDSFGHGGQGADEYIRKSDGLA